MLESVAVKIGEAAAYQIHRNAAALTSERCAALVRWLEGLSSRKLMSAGVELEGLGSSKLYEFKGAGFAVRFVIDDGAPLVTELLFN